MFSQDDRMDGIQHTTHSTPHQAGGRPSPHRAAAAAPRPQAAAACPVPGHGDTGRDPAEPCWGRGVAIRTPLTSHSLPQTCFGAARRASWPDGWTDKPRWGPCHRQPRAKRHANACRALGLRRRVIPADGTASSALGAWHSLTIFSLAHSANAFPVSRLLSLG